MRGILHRRPMRMGGLPDKGAGKALAGRAVMAEKDYNLEEKTMKKIKSVFEWD